MAGRAADFATPCGLGTSLNMRRSLVDGIIILIRAAGK